MKRKKMKPIPRETKEQWARNQQRLLDRIQELGREVAAKDAGEQRQA